MNILVTGGCGFIGSHICTKLVQNDHHVVCLDNFMSGSVWNINHLLSSRNFKIITGDVRDRQLVDNLVRDIDIIIHLAAQVHVDRSVVEPEMTWEVNVKGTQNILESAKFFDTKRIIVASSSEVYGSNKYYEPMTEDHSLDAPHPYGASKIAVDRMCFSYIKTFNMDIVILRCFNVFGPRQKDSGYGGVVSLFIKRVLNNQPPIIFGEGLQSRDYTYIDDIVDAYEKAIYTKKNIQCPVNIGSGVDIKIKDIANLIIQKIGSSLVPSHTAPRLNEVMCLLCDASKAQEYLKWKPKISFDSGISKLIDWYKIYGTP